MQLHYILYKYLNYLLLYYILLFIYENLSW